MKNIFRAATGRLVREKQYFAAKQMPKDYRELIAKKIHESPYGSHSDFAGPHFMIFNHYHINLGTNDLDENLKHRCFDDLPLNIRCICELATAFDRSWLVKLAENLENMGFVTILGEISLNEPIPYRSVELPVRQVTHEQMRAAGFFLDGS